MRPLTCVCFVIPALILCAAAWGQGFVKADGSGLTLDGKPYRAVGVNMPHLSQAYLETWFHWAQIYGTREAMKQSIVEALEDAAESKVAFIRFFATPGYPKDTAELYLADPDEYWRRMDELFELCRGHNIRLVPSLGVLGMWYLDYGESRRAILDPESMTYESTYRYVEEFVTRYKDDPLVLMWELGNEHFLHADVNMEGRPAPGQGIYPDGAPPARETYSQDDSVHFDELAKFQGDMAAYIMGLDPNHLVTSGDAAPREESQSRRETFPDFAYRWDSLRQHLANLLHSQPEPLDVLSVHMYGNFDTRRKVGDLLHMELLRHYVRAAHVAQMPAFVGELGQTDPHLPDDPEAKWTRAAIDMLEEEGASLIALWVWHFPWQDKDFNIPSSDAQPQLVERMAAFNGEYAGMD